MRPSLDPTPSMAAEPSVLSAHLGLVFLVGCNPDRPAELPWPALAALAAADVVLYDAGVNRGILALIPGSCFAEQVSGGTAGSAARIAKLAGEGWRVVRLSCDDPTAWPTRLAEADQLAATGITVCTLADPPGDRPVVPDPAAVWASPRPLPTGMNGLAG